MQLFGRNNSTSAGIETTQWRVVKAHQATYADPITFGIGDKVNLTGRIDVWDGHRWLWAVAPDGREGWIPDSFVDGEVQRGDHFVSDIAYSAVELTCDVGEQLEGAGEMHGWVWARNSLGAEGWAPLRNLTLISDPPKPNGDQN